MNGYQVIDPVSEQFRFASVFMGVTLNLWIT